jgi:folylpolyglutamate synthase/dihydropteroate synthase
MQQIFVMDHCEVLGHTIEEICHEKCGIIKKTQVFVGPTVPLEVVY